jgi:hypothetical protein
MHFREACMDASFGTAAGDGKGYQADGTRPGEPGAGHLSSLPLTEIHKAVEVMVGTKRNKVLINP